MGTILWRTGALACALMMAGSTQAAAESLCSNVSGNLLLNCGFESGLLDWSGTGDFGLSARSQSGSLAAYLAHTALSEGTISQEVATEAGRPYDLEFWVLGDILGDPFQAIWNGASVFSIFATPDTLNVYRPIQVVTGTGADTLSFFGAGTDPGGDHTWYVDDVSLVARNSETVPEPSTLFVLGTGIAGVLRWRSSSMTRRSRRRARSFINP